MSDEGRMRGRFVLKMVSLHQYFYFIDLEIIMNDVGSEYYGRIFEIIQMKNMLLSAS
jgi:hypothetical protein